MVSPNLPPIIQAAQHESITVAALAYAALGLSIIPLDGKRPALTSWTQFQQKPADEATIRAWTQAGLFGNVGIVCGAVSGNLVVFDLDATAGYAAFAATFPHLAETYTVASGGGVGRHVYFYAEQLAAERQSYEHAHWSFRGMWQRAAGGRAAEYPPDYGTTVPRGQGARHSARAQSR